MNNTASICSSRSSGPRHLRYQQQLHGQPGHALCAAVTCLCAAASTHLVRSSSADRFIRPAIPPRSPMDPLTSPLLPLHLHVCTCRWINPLMGWTSTSDPLENVGRSTLLFHTKEEAVAFCNKHGWEAVVREHIVCFAARTELVAVAVVCCLGLFEAPCA